MKIALLGKDGQVGYELQRALAPHGELVSLGRDTVDLDNLDNLRRVLRALAPSVIVNAAAYTAVDNAESEPHRAGRINAEAVGVLAEEARQMNAWLVHYSTDYVFDGTKTDPHVEDDHVGPLSVYGRTKLDGENALRAVHARHLIFRTSWVYSARGTNFVKTMLRLAKERDRIEVVADQYGAPTSAALIADTTSLALYRLALANEASRSLAGTYHLAAAGETNWCDYARYVIGLALKGGAALKATPERIEGIPTEQYPTRAVRPKNSRLDTSKLQAAFSVRMPAWKCHVARTVQELMAREAA